MKSKKFEMSVYFVVLLLILYCQHIQLSYSATIGMKKIILMDYKWQIVSIMITIILYLIFLLLLNNRIYALLFSSILISGLSVANYYVLLFHGSPFLASDFYSINTALNVFSEYQIKIDIIVLRIIFLFLFEIILVLIVRKICKSIKTAYRQKTLTVLAFDSILLWIHFFSPWTCFPFSLVTWSWGPAVNQYGYEITLFNSAYMLNHKFIVPDGYSGEKLYKTEDSYPITEVQPDIIVILNETLCDLSFYSEIEEGHEVLEPIYNIPGIISGYSTVSLVGGGTNNSEYELLTSNSMSGLAISAPFQVLNMKGANSIVSYLQALGYETVGMHCGNKANYARNKAYYDIGFDHVYLGKDAFSYFNKYGKRPWLDEDNYKDMINAYESCGENPRFVYLLTFQNHGGYEVNESSYDTVSINKDMGEYTDDVNEYLSSVSKSSNAFCELTDYFKKSDRPVIILMVGDHAPVFVPNLPGRSEFVEYENAIAQRTVPYFVWSNTDLVKKSFSYRSSLVDLIPMLLRSANFPLTSYYKTILDLNQDVPVRAYNGTGMDSSGKFFRIQDGEELYDKIQYYFCMEYNNLKKGNDYRQELFELDKDE